MLLKLLCFCSIAIFLTQSASRHNGGWWKPRPSRERPSKERPSHEWHHSHEHSSETSEETSEDYDGSEGEGDVSETPETGQTASRTTEGEGTTGVTNSEYNDTITTFRCVEGYCYHVVRNTTYPPQCPYQDSVSFAEYSEIILPYFVSAVYLRFWINVKRNPDYGYYEWLEPGDDYGNIFDDATYNGGNCITLVPGATASFTTDNCTLSRQGLCIHRLKDKIKNFCNVYEEICGTSSRCYCYAKNVKYLCQTNCQNYVNTDCDVCEDKFDSYPEADIKLQFAEPQGLIYITVKNSLKLIYSNKKSESLISCFTDVYTPSTSSIRNKYNASEMTLVNSGDDFVIYTIVPRDLGPGRYWCEGFIFPNKEIVTSNVIVAGIPEDYGTDFVLNVTVQLGDGHSFLPYNIHTRSAQAINETVNSENFQSIRPSYISELWDDKTKVNISLHLTSVTGVGASDAYSELVEALESLNSEEITLGDLSNSRKCPSDVTVINKEEIEWPEAFLGQVVAPNEGVFLQKNGISITRLCLGSFQSGTIWSDVIGEVTTKSISGTTLALFEITASSKTAEKLNVALQNILHHYDEYIAYDIYLIALIFQSVAQSEDPFDMDIYMDNVNTVMGLGADVLATSQTALNATDIILYNLDLALIASVKNNKASEDDVHNVTVTVTEFVLAQVVNLKANNDIIGVAVYEDNDGFIMKNITIGTTVDEIKLENLIFATLLPPILLAQILEELQHLDEINMVTAIFLNGALFNGGNKSITHNSIVLSLFIDRFDGVFLKEAIPIIFKAKSSNGEQAKYCGYWKYGIDESWVSLFGSWKVDVHAIYDEAYSMCNYTHTTHFALLVNGVDNVVLNVISIIGCVLSILGTIGVFATAAISKSWREGTSTKIILHFSAAILIQMVVLVFSDLIDANRQRALCILTGITLHYTILVQFLWMLIISYLQYRKFVQVLVHEPDRLIIKTCAFAWGLPIVLIIIVTSFDINSYRTYGICYLSDRSLHLGIFLPVMIVILINIVMFVLIFKSVLYRKAQAYGVNKKLLGLKVRLAVILFFLMGFSWIFGLFAGVLNSLFLSYIFSLTATIQGFVIYVYFVVCNKATRNIWMKRINKMRGKFNSSNKVLVNEDTSTSDDSSKYKK